MCIRDRALGDPTRLEMVRRLAQAPHRTIGELSENLGISRQGARKQLQVLVSAKLVSLHQHGRKTQVQLDKQTLETARLFIAKLESQWDQRLQALKQLAERPST